MNNIFEGAKFGDKFLTRDGRIAIYIRGTSCLIEHEDYEDYIKTYSHNGSLGLMKGGEEIESNLDIVSRYHEPIDEKELEKLLTF